MVATLDVVAGALESQPHSPALPRFAYATGNSFHHGGSQGTLRDQPTMRPPHPAAGSWLTWGLAALLMLAVDAVVAHTPLIWGKTTIWGARSRATARTPGDLAGVRRGARALSAAAAGGAACRHSRQLVGLVSRPSGLRRARAAARGTGRRRARRQPVLLRRQDRRHRDRLAPVVPPRPDGGRAGARRHRVGADRHCRS